MGLKGEGWRGMMGGGRERGGAQYITREHNCQVSI